MTTFVQDSADVKKDTEKNGRKRGRERQKKEIEGRMETQKG